ncbi:hypothetical protein KUTeg_000399 [Tegillarca granosa]|uniref:Uncharacterized protein n=1 Tax=Tegillarca granosa TaxID=220873 RepID=A0ABQ9G1S6_TEGGR|nr:hypothetical protein KUTeg_000399 [Tegillarca granosa]
MTTCCVSSLLAKIAMLVILISFVCGTIAIFTPYWTEQSANSTVTFSGLFANCTSLSSCLDFSSVLDAYKGTDFYDDFIATLSLQLAGWIAIFAATIIMIIYACACCADLKIIGYVAIILSLLGGSLITAGIIVYGVGLNALQSAVLSWSFGLDIACAALALAAGVIMLVNICVFD